MYKFFIPFLFFVSFSLNAKVTKIAVITSEFDQNVTDYFIETDEKNVIVSMRYVTTMPNGGVFEDVSVTAERAMAEGIVVVERNGYEAVRLELENFDLTNGGIVKLNYLFNGMTGTRREKRLILKLNQDEFILFNLNNNPVNKMFLEANRLRVVGIVGVKSILTSFSALQ